MNNVMSILMVEDVPTDAMLIGIGLHRRTYKRPDKVYLSRLIQNTNAPILETKKGESWSNLEIPLVDLIWICNDV